MNKLAISVCLCCVLAVGTVSASPVTWSGNGHRYDVVDYRLHSWEAAKADAEARGGYLATLTSAEELQFVANNLLHESGTGLSYWIGGCQDPATGNWRWITGEAWSYTNWILGAPNDPGWNNKLEMNGNPLDPTYYTKWNDVGGGDEGWKGRYIIEVPEPSSIALILLGGLAFGAKRRQAAGRRNSPVLS